MKYLNLDAEGRLLSVSDIPFKGCVACDVDGFDFSGHRVLAYRFDGEKLVLDEDKLAELDAEKASAEEAENARIMAAEQREKEQAAAIFLAREMAQSYTLTDDQRLSVVDLYPAWEAGKAYPADTYITYGKNSVGDPQLYKVVQAHTSAAEWLPDAAASLYTAIGLDNSGYPVWSQPTGAHDAYNAGDVVNYNGVLYKSLIDGNVYSPEAYPAGWEEVNNAEP